MNFKRLLFWLFAPLVLLMPAFYNGYPLVYSDTGTYIRSGMELIIPPDRPPMYGLFIRIFSFDFSLWPVLYIQSLIVVVVLWHLFKIAYRPIAYWKFLVLLVPLSWFTGLGWYSSQIMPDIFTFTAIGSALLMALPERTSTFTKIVLAGILVFSVNVHFSNFFITVASLAIIFSSRVFIGKEINLKVNYFVPLVLLIISIATASLTNFAVGSTFKINQGSHVFLMGKMLDSGVLKSFLDDNCSEGTYILCQYKDSLPADSRKLLWDADSPLFKHGGWKNSEKPYNEVLIGIFSSPKHLALYGYNSVISSLSQLFQNDIGSGLVSTWYREPDSPPSIEISKYFDFELNQYNTSRQNGNLWYQELDFGSINVVNSVALFFSSLFLVICFASAKVRKLINARVKLIVIALVAGVLSNAIVVASLANVYDRLQARISWVLIFSVILIIFSNGTTILQKVKNWLFKSRHI